MSHRGILAFAFAALVAGCAAEPPPAPKAVQAPPKPAAAKPAQEASGHLARNNVERVLRMGPAWIFRRVMREEVLDNAGQLLGWRLTALPEEWKDIDLKPGDIVTKVNGVAIVRPDDAWNVWKGIATAKEIRIDYDRAGAPRVATFPIDGEPSPDVVRAYQSDQPPARPPMNKKGTIVIEGDDSLTRDGDSAY